MERGGSSIRRKGWKVREERRGDPKVALASVVAALALEEAAVAIAGVGLGRVVVDCMKAGGFAVGSVADSKYLGAVADIGNIAWAMTDHLGRILG